MKIFTLGLPFTPTVDPTIGDSVDVNPFMELIWFLTKMFHERGHEVIHLGVPGSNPPCTKNITITTQEAFDAIYKNRTPNDPRNAEMEGPCKPYQEMYAANAVKAIQENGGEPWTSLVLGTWGGPQQWVEERIRNFQFYVEPAIGYCNTYAPFRVYQSYAWMHYDMGRKLKLWEGEKWYWTVIPPIFDMNLFGPVIPTKEKEKYFMIQARFNRDKGHETAIWTAKELGIPIKLSGRGNPAPYKALWPEGIEVLGNTSVEGRRQLLRHARACFQPTYYVEPFGAIAIEASASGCPMITTDFGGLVDSVVHGGNGYRCRTFEEFVWAAKNIDKIDPYACREWAVKNYSLEHVAPLYEDFFESILRLKGQGIPGQDGWMSRNPGRTCLDRAFRDYSMFKANDSNSA
jgi:hypothetical protein